MVVHGWSLLGSVGSAARSFACVQDTKFLQFLKLFVQALLSNLKYLMDLDTSMPFLRT